MTASLIEQTRGRRRASIRSFPVALAALLSLCVLTVLIGFLRSRAPSYPVGDLAIIELYTLHTLRGHTLRGAWLLGPYSQYVWNHPGPLYFYLLAPLYAASGERALALNVTAWLLNLGCAATILWVTLRALPPRVRVCVLAMLTLYIARIQPLFTSSWNPHVLVMPLMAIMFLAGMAGSGRPWIFALIAVFASFLAQTHVGLVPITASIVLTTLLLAHWRAWRVATIALVILWLPPLIQEIIATPGNLTRLYQFFVTNAAAKLGWTQASYVWADLITGVFRPGLTMPVGWGVTPQRNIAALAGAIAQCALLVVATRWYWRRRTPVLATLCGVGLVASGTALWSIAQIRGMVFDHAVFWVSAVGAVNWSLAAGFLCEALPLRAAFVRARPGFGDRVAARAATAVGIAGMLGLIAVGGLRIARMSEPATNASPSHIEAVADAIAARIATSSSRRTLCRIDQTVWDEAAGVILQLYKRGAPIVVDASWTSMYGAPLAPTGQEQSTLDFLPRNAKPDTPGVVAGCTPTLCAVISAAPRE